MIMTATNQEENRTGFMMNHGLHHKSIWNIHFADGKENQVITCRSDSPRTLASSDLRRMVMYRL